MQQQAADPVTGGTPGKKNGSAPGTIKASSTHDSSENAPQRMAFDLTDTGPELQVLGKRVKRASYPLIRLP